MTSEVRDSGDPPRRLTLTRGALLRLLDRVDAQAGRGATIYLPPFSRPSTLPSEMEAAAAFIDESATGSVVISGNGPCLAVAPPFAVEEAASFDRYQTAPLRELLERPRTLGVILVRLGGYSVGVYRDGAFVETKTGGRFVKNRHRKGGQSQRRFERIREGQIREHFDDVADVVRGRLLPVAAELDAVVLGGDRHTVQSMLKRAPLPPALSAKVLPRTLDVPEPRRDVLERSPTAIWSSRVLILRAPAGEPG